MDNNATCVAEIPQSWLDQQNYSVHVLDAGAVLELERLKHDVLEDFGLSLLLSRASHSNGKT